MRRPPAVLRRALARSLNWIDVRLAVLLGGLLVCLAAAPSTDISSQQTPRRVILVIADGAGMTHWSFLPVVLGSRTLDSFPVTGLVVPRGTSTRVIDSAASATAYAIGIATVNGAIGVGPDYASHQTVLEAAEEAGMATGLVTTTSITDATPAAFAAHVPDRDDHPEIAEQLASSDIEVLMGDGLGYFDGSLRPDRRNLVPELAERTALVHSPEELAGIDTDTTEALVGLFGRSSRPALDPVKPRLHQMAGTALDILSRDDDGFFLLVESEGSDEAAHSNVPLGSLAEIMADLDEAIQVALEYRERNPETLLIVTADHETGGAALHTRSGENHSLEYTTGGHTASMVPLFAVGPGADAFAGVRDGDEVGRLLRRAVVGEPTD